MTAFAQGLVEFAQQFALVLGELDRCFHGHVAIQIAGIAGPHAFDAFATQSELLAGLRAFGQIDGCLAL